MSQWLDSSHNFLWLNSNHVETMVNRLESRFSPNASTRFRVIFINSPNIWLTNPVRLHIIKWAFCASATINIGAKFLFWLCLLVVLSHILSMKCSTQHRGRAETLLFTERPAGHNTLNTQWFKVVFAYCDHGSRSHTLLWVFSSVGLKGGNSCLQNPIPMQNAYFKIQWKLENQCFPKSKFLFLSLLLGYSYMSGLESS